MSSSDPNISPPVISPPSNSSEDVELVLEDEIKERSPERMNVGGNDDDDEIGIVDIYENFVFEDVPDVPVPALFSEEYFRQIREIEETAEKFFDPASSTHVANLAAETRMDMARYAAAIFEWICCLPSTDLLTEIYMGDVELPFPVPKKSKTKASLVRREFGARLSDVWRQTKSTAKLANHFKLQEPVALLSLLDYAFQQATNASFDLDMFPLLKAHEISREDYCTVVQFIMTHSHAQLWQEPEMLLCETMLPPAALSIALCLMNTECCRGTAVTIPWEEMNIDLRALSSRLVEDQKIELQQAFEQLSIKTPESEKREEGVRQLRELETSLATLKKEVQAITAQSLLSKTEAIKLKQNHELILKRRRTEIEQTLPDNWEAHGTALAKADEVLIVGGDRFPQARFHKLPNLTREDVDEVDEGCRVLARRKVDSSERFEDAVFVKRENLSTVLIRFSDQRVLAIPLACVAPMKSKQPLTGKIPVSSEGVRVAALAHHPLQKRGSPPSYYSGTIISKYYTDTEDFAVAFDDFFEDYVSAANLHLLMTQPFNERDAFDKSLAYTLITPNPAIPKATTEERIVFLMQFFCSYPEWGLVRMADRVGRNVSTFHRNGEGWVAQALKVERQMVWLRFNPKQTFENANQGCLDLPCKAHDHHDEPMYRGNPRLKQARVTCNFDVTMDVYRNISESKKVGGKMHVYIMKEVQERTAKAAQRRRQPISHGIAIEPAIPMETKKVADVKPPSQTARKCGTVLRIEAAMQAEGLRPEKRDIPVTLRRHEVVKEKYDTESRGGTMYHEKCSAECLRGMDGDPFEAKFTDENISPFYIPVLCGWRRIKQDFSFEIVGREKDRGTVYYRAPCGKPLFLMSEVLDYLDETRSELTVDVFSFSWELDETVYVYVEEKYYRTHDLAQKSEARPIPVVNEIDNDPLPPFTYRARRYPYNEKISTATTNKEFCSGCDCEDDCRDWTKCACQRQTHRESVRTRHAFSMTTKGYTNRLLFDRVSSGIYECNENCGCSRKRCINRVVQGEIKVPIQMVKTPGMGWGVRALVDIPHGTFISCYHGALLSDELAEKNTEGDEYYADLDFYNIVENEKEIAGIDMLADQGVFFEDVGARDLTEAEVALAEVEDELVKLRKEEDRRRRIQRGREAAEAAKQEQSQKPRKQRPMLQADNKEELEQEMRRIQVQESVEEVSEPSPETEEDPEPENVEDDTQDDEQEEEEGSQDGEEEGEGEGDSQENSQDGEEEEEGNGEEEVDEGVDEGVEEDHLSDTEEGTEEDEREVSSASPLDEEARKQEEARQAIKAEEEARVNAVKREQTERQMQMKEDAKNRYTIPLRDSSGRNQMESYFEDANCDSLFLIDAKSAGNIGRQFNHSCDPNMFTQHIFVDTHDVRLPWSAFFAKRDIKAGEELCWDYGWAPDEKKPRGVKCLCGASNCRITLL